MKTIRKLKMLSYLGMSRMAPTTRDVANRINGEADAGDRRTLRSIQRDLAELQEMGLVEAVQEGAVVRWMVRRADAA